MRGLRVSGDWSQSDLGAHCQRAGWDAGRGIVTKIEAGQRQVTDRELVALAWVLGVTVSELVGESALPETEDARSALLASRRASRAGAKISSLIPHR